MQQGNITSINWNASNFFSGYVNENNIYTYNGELIGVNLAKYQEVENALSKCKDKLIELGVIKIPKTPDDIIREQSEMLEKQGQALNQTLEMCQQMKQQIEVMQNGRKSNTRINEFPAQEPEGQGDSGNIFRSGTNLRTRTCYIAEYGSDPSHLMIRRA